MISFLEILYSLFNGFESIVGNFYFILIATSVSFLLKAFILGLLARISMKLPKINKSFSLMFLFLIGTMVSDSAWIVRLSKTLFFPTLDYRISLFIIRIAWGFAIIAYQAIALLIENFADKNNQTKMHQKVFIFISSLLTFFFFFLAFYNFNCKTSGDRPLLEFTMYKITSFYMLFPLVLTALILTIRKVRKTKIPRLLKRQLKIFIQFIICPLIIFDFIQTYPFSFIATTIANNYTTVGLSTLISTYAIFHCMRKIMGLRFLNIQNHVQSQKKFSFIDDFKNILDQLSQVTNEKELGHITQNFFKDAFTIPSRRTRFYIRKINQTNTDSEFTTNTDEEKVENFISTYNQDSDIAAVLVKNKIIITDEVEFSNFYENNEIGEKILSFMSNISADIFIPIYEKQTMTAYIIVERYARINQENKNADFYSNVERDQMLVFPDYLGNIIKLLQSKNLTSLIQQEKELKEELYRKHQEINQYKESIRSFLRNTNQKKIGIIFYKNRRFTFGNQTAQELIHIKLNTHDGHPITKKLKKLANQVIEYKTPQTCFTNTKKGEDLVVSAIPNIENNNVIILVYYPEISDLLKKKIDLLNDPTKWDYLLYLETTKSGKLINQLIPGNGETLLNFKIDLLKIALSKKAILLDIPEQDLIHTVEILHHINLRETLHILDLQKATNNFDTATKLFGINPIFGLGNNNEKPLLEKLDNSGTLFIKNIHLLEQETQKYLAEFIKFGFFRRFKGDQKTFSNVRIICSTNINLQSWVQEGKFSQSLFNELNKTSLSMPSLMTLSEGELENLTSGFTEQAIKKTNEFQHILELTDSEKRRIVRARPASFAELKTKIQNILIKKSKQHAIYEETQFDPAYDVSDPELVEAIRLGKHALRDKKIMVMLWNKFKNQNKIAHLLGVNRSSVNRRCKEYDLI